MPLLRSRTLLPYLALLAAAVLAPKASQAQLPPPCGPTPGCPACTLPQCSTDGWACTGFVAAGTGCNPRNACISGATCDGAGGCVGTAVTCSALDQCHVAGPCDPSTGVWSNPTKANGTACSTANACVSGETCQNGTCGFPQTTVTCTALDQCHVAGTCSPSTGVCSNPTKANGTACSNGMCGSGESCQNGTCGWPTSTVTCAPPNQCQTGAGSCNSSTGLCSYPTKPNGTVCDDGLICTSGKTCQNETCTATANSCNWTVIRYAYDQIGNLTSQRPEQCAATTCAAQGKTCGTIADGCGGSLACGLCSAGQVCLSSNTCCQPTSCAAQGSACGTISDGCGGHLSCGTCSGNWVCGGANVCICPPGAVCCAAGYTNCPCTASC